jgi:hypothetical protein
MGQDCITVLATASAPKLKLIIEVVTGAKHAI